MLLKPRPIPSYYLGSPRLVRVYLPPSYHRAPERRYPVLYCHDGQNVFSSAGPHACFGWGSWSLDVTADRSIAAGRMQEILIVAVDNARSRYLEYRGPAYPYTGEQLAALARKPPAAGDNSHFARYLAFLIHELKPGIDREFRTLPEAQATGILGSSLGGIASLAAAWKHPHAFALAGSLSGSFQIERKQFLQTLRAYRGHRKSLRVYLDSGVRDHTGDDDGRRNTLAVAEELRRIGWHDDANLLHFIDDQWPSDEEFTAAGLPPHKWEEARKSQHNEFYWRQRAWRALAFLFPPGRGIASRSGPEPA